jgi:hypothetical protein
VDRPACSHTPVADAAQSAHFIGDSSVRSRLILEMACGHDEGFPCLGVRKRAFLWVPGEAGELRGS